MTDAEIEREAGTIFEQKYKNIKEKLEPSIYYGLKTAFVEGYYIATKKLGEQL